MSDASSLPILLDADTGYGNFNNARRLVRKLEERGVAGACMEDKLFPKTNSLLDGRAQPLADIEEFALKIKACKGFLLMIKNVITLNISYSFCFMIFVVYKLTKFNEGSTEWLCVSFPKAENLVVVL